MGEKKANILSFIHHIKNFVMTHFHEEVVSVISLSEGVKFKPSYSRVKSP